MQKKKKKRLKQENKKLIIERMQYLNQPGLFFIFILSVDAHVVSDYWDKAYLAVTNNNRLVSNCTGQSLKLITIVDSLCFLI